MTERDDIPLGYTYDVDGNELTYKDSRKFDGVLLHARATDGEYTLFVSDAGQVSAGCRRFRTIVEALAHWQRTDGRAVLFTAALKKEQKL